MKRWPDTARWRLRAEVFVWRQGWLATVLLALALLLLAHEGWQWRRAQLAWRSLQASAPVGPAGGAKQPGADIPADTHADTIAQLSADTPVDALANTHANTIAPLSADPGSSPAARPGDAELGERLPPAAPPAETVDALLQASRAAGLAWPRASHRAEEQPADGPARWRVTQTTPGDYPALRQAVLATLAALPHVSLDRLSVRRGTEGGQGTAGRGSLESTLEWSIWTRPTNGSLALPPERSGWRLRARSAPEAGAPPRDLFAALAAPTPSQPPQPPVPPPSAPPPPPPPEIRVLGKQWDGERWLVFVSEGAHTSLLREGDALQDGQRVERIDPPTLLLRRDGAEAAQSVPIGDAP